MNIDGLKQINQDIVKRAVENKVFENGTIDGYGGRDRWTKILREQ
ncbi:hypothetical protein [Desulfosporosinus acidiphilus]|nr:hypothetical protein [Desulfosporosinus acidiphilus]